MRSNYGAIILAGGKSERMNYPKPFLTDNGKNFLQKIVEEYYYSRVKDICLVINRNFCEGEWKKHFEQVVPYVKTIEKTDPEEGRFHSIKLGIKNLLYADFLFIQNADNPFVNNRIITSLKRHRLALGYTQLFHQGHKGHPILISKRIINTINNIHDNDYNLRTILEDFPKTDLETEDNRVLANINTQEDYQKYFAVNT